MAGRPHSASSGNRRELTEEVSKDFMVFWIGSFYPLLFAPR
jgi:hypothetical protein